MYSLSRTKFRIFEICYSRSMNKKKQKISRARSYSENDASLFRKYSSPRIEEKIEGYVFFPERFDRACSLSTFEREICTKIAPDSFPDSKSAHLPTTLDPNGVFAPDFSRDSSWDFRARCLRFVSRRMRKNKILFEFRQD